MIGAKTLETSTAAITYSEVIKLSYLSSSIAVVAMEDRESKNTFSTKLTQGLLEVFTVINKNTDIKVVIIHGYDNYFCCGGTKDELLELSKGDINFTDFGFYRLLLDCPVPVISAMQGHAIGGGLAFGTFADMLVMAEEAFYSTNFMKYGFTPGFGSTYIIPKKFGISIAENMLFGTQNYQGIQLKDWGVAAKFAKKADVIAKAIELAQEIAVKSRETLIKLKQSLTFEDQLRLPIFIEKEVAMHAISFKLPEVKLKINELFGR
jgi:polyketide biosynthesis enoyl-CoA hydratase PksI